MESVQLNIANKMALLLLDERPKIKNPHLSDTECLHENNNMQNVLTVWVEHGHYLENVLLPQGPSCRIVRGEEVQDALHSSCG